MPVVTFLLINRNRLRNWLMILILWCRLRLILNHLLHALLLNRSRWHDATYLNRRNDWWYKLIYLCGLLNYWIRKLNS